MFLLTVFFVSLNKINILVRTTPYLYIPDDKAKLTRSMKRKYGVINESLQVRNLNFFFHVFYMKYY